MMRAVVSKRSRLGWGVQSKALSVKAFASVDPFTVSGHNPHIVQNFGKAFYLELTQ